MRIKLKEDPKAWRTFTLQFCGLMALLAGWLAWRGIVSGRHLPWILALAVTVALLAWWRPRGFRSFYRFGMVTSAWLGERVGRVVLTVFFFIVITPFGWVLRLFGKDPLNLRRQQDATSYWQPADKPGSLDKMF